MQHFAMILQKNNLICQIDFYCLISITWYLYIFIITSLFLTLSSTLVIYLHVCKCCFLKFFFFHYCDIFDWSSSILHRQVAEILKVQYSAMSSQPVDPSDPCHVDMVLGSIIQPLLQACRMGGQSLSKGDMALFMLNNVSALQVHLILYSIFLLPIIDYIVI